MNSEWTMKTAPFDPVNIISVNPCEWPFSYSPDGEPLHCADLEDDLWVKYKRAVEYAHKDGAPLQGFCAFNKKWFTMYPKRDGEPFYWKTTEYRICPSYAPLLNRGTRFAQRQQDGSVKYIQQPNMSPPSLF
jgi:hypothetical protein